MGKTTVECCICRKPIRSEKRLYLNCNDHPQDPHCGTCNNGEGCLLAIGSDCAKKFKGKIREIEAPKNMRGLGFEEQLKLSGFNRISGSRSCMRLGDIAHDDDPGWQNLFQAKINSARKDGYDAYVLHEKGWHGYYESATKECSMGICNCK